jgi:hypothetical protein
MERILAENLADRIAQAIIPSKTRINAMSKAVATWLFRSMPQPHKQTEPIIENKIVWAPTFFRRA